MHHIDTLAPFLLKNLGLNDLRLSPRELRFAPYFSQRVPAGRQLPWIFLANGSELGIFFVFVVALW
jgi:hypothetical protein